MARRNPDETRVKRLLLELIDDNDPALTVTPAGRSRSALVLSICRRLGLEGTHYPGVIAKILLNKAHAGKIEVYQGQELVSRPDADSIKYATRICKPAPVPAVDQGSLSVDRSRPRVSPANRAVTAHDQHCRDVLVARLEAIKWTPQMELVRDIVFWFLWQQPDYTYAAGRVRRTDILEAAHQDPQDKNLLQALSNGLLFLEKHRLIERTVKGKTTQRLCLLVELDTQTVQGLTLRFTGQAPTLVVEAENETTEMMMRRVVREELTTFASGLVESFGLAGLFERVGDIEQRLRDTGKSLLGPTGDIT